jgi:hypothetical protein
MTASTFGPVVLVGLTSGLIGPALLATTHHRTATTNTPNDRRRRMR